MKNFLIMALLGLSATTSRAADTNTVQLTPAFVNTLVEELRTKTQFILVSAASVQESHPHDILITQEAPNYSSRGAPQGGGRLFPF